MNCAIIYFCLLIGCRSNEPNDQISESRYVATSILYAHGMSQRLLRLPPDMANINVMTYVAPMRCDAMRLPYLFDLSTYLRRRQVAKLRVFAVGIITSTFHTKLPERKQPARKTRPERVQTHLCKVLSLEDGGYSAVRGLQCGSNSHLKICTKNHV